MLKPRHTILCERERESFGEVWFGQEEKKREREREREKKRERKGELEQ